MRKKKKKKKNAARSVRVVPSAGPEWVADLRWHGDWFALRSAISHDSVTTKFDRAEGRRLRSNHRKRGC